MHHRSWWKMTLTILATALSLALAAGPALALPAPIKVPADTPTDFGPTQATSIPDGDNWFIATENGEQFCVGANNLNAYTTLLQKGSGYDGYTQHCRTLTDHYVGEDSDGYPEYEFSFSNGYYMAANDSCDTAVIKPSSSDSGTVWESTEDSSGHIYLASRLCHSGNNYEVLAGTNTLDDSWRVSYGGPGLYVKIRMIAR